MPSQKKIKQQRDRFLAFSFASADLFIEADPKGKIVYALGAARGLTGIDEDTLIGKNWLQLFEMQEHSRLIKMQDEAIPAMRCGPFLVQMEKTIIDRKGIVTAIKMPGTNNFYITLGLSNSLMDTLANLMENDGNLVITTGFKAEDENDTTATTGFTAEDEKNPDLTTGFKAEDETKQDAGTDFKAEDQKSSGITTGFVGEEGENTALTTGFMDSDDEEMSVAYNKDDFIQDAEATFDIAREMNIDADLTVFEVERTETIPDEKWDEIIGEISKFLRQQSINGGAAAEISDTKLSIVHDGTITSEIMREQISSLTKEFDPSGGGIDISSKTISTDLDKMTSQEAARALFYTINEFEKKGTKLDITSLDAGFKKCVKQNSSKLSAFAELIDRVDFDVHFQPVVDLQTRAIENYEVLSRFKDGTTQDWIMFGEDVGLAANFDVAVVERVMNFIHYKAGTTRTRFSINISESSIANDDFLVNLTEQLAKRDLANRLIFEITNGTKIKDIRTIKNFIGPLKDRGYLFMLDDCDGQAQTLSNIKKLDLDFVKIDGRHIRKMLNSARSETTIRKLVKACKQARIKTIAENIETKEQLDFLKEIGVDFGQGFAIGKPRPKPDYTPPIL